MDLHAGSVPGNKVKNKGKQHVQPSISAFYVASGTVMTRSAPSTNLSIFFFTPSIPSNSADN